MKAYYSDGHWAHAPEAFLNRGALRPSPERPERAAILLEGARRAGLVCAVVPPALRERNLDHPSLDPFYAAAADLELPLAVHGAPGVHLPKIGVDRFTNYIQVHSVSFPFDQMTAMTSMITSRFQLITCATPSIGPDPQTLKRK